MTESDHALNTELLNAELPGPRFADEAYLRWLYDQNPHGRAVYANADENGRRMAHYAVIPQEYRNANGPAPMVFSLNAVTRSGAQGRGYFTNLGREIYARAAEMGALGVIGVSNVNSTPPVVRKLGFRLMGPLPVLMVPRGWGRSVHAEHIQVDPAELASKGFEDLAGDLDMFKVRGWVNRWTPPYLRWRLSPPNMASPYWIHRTDEIFAVTARTTLKGMRVAVVLKLLPRGAPRERLEAGPLISEMCRFHHAAVAIYAGFNRHVRVRGLRLPVTVQPSPLNLIFLGLSPQLPNESFVLEMFEFLDMDAY